MKYIYTVARSTVNSGMWYVLESTIDADGVGDCAVIDKTTSEVAAKDMAAVYKSSCALEIV
jgi:hypothetical protein